TEYKSSALLPPLTPVSGTPITGELQNTLFLQTQFGTGDGIGLRVKTNPDHLGPVDWYYANSSNPGTPSKLKVDGYSAATEGRSTYINATNQVNSDIYTNMFILSYSQEANAATKNIFNQLYSNWILNTNITSVDRKAMLARDTRRWEDIVSMRSALSSYAAVNDGNYPPLGSGSYLAGTSVSVWDSWNNNLGPTLGITMPTDPINQHVSCPAGHDSLTCWNPTNTQYTCPLNSHVYRYTNLVGDYSLSVNFEFEPKTNSVYIWRGNTVAEDLAVSISSLCDQINFTAVGSGVDNN
ncbi:MAG: hypothetical protein NUV82_02910, partial [Candidatus Komeilibacteria bacterium]|nr:hypothetical protein [Candidatus Komeilibacteria bacterium]